MTKIAEFARDPRKALKMLIHYSKMGGYKKEGVMGSCIVETQLS